MSRRISVAVEPAYDIVVGPGVLDEIGSLLGDRRQVAVVTQRAIAEHYAAGVLAALESTGTKAEVFSIDNGEDAKTLATVEELCRGFAAWGLLRGDAVCALGGGVVGDVGGFAAASFHRGVAVAQVPTTLLAQVDAAIGGKTGVNLPEGKNLVGAFHQPIGVLSDTTTLATLADREFRSGLGEVAKYALMGDAELDTLVGARTEALLARDAEVLSDVVARCAVIKAAVVASDPQERTGVRATLNYGHTLAHALETAGGYQLAHGEAVAVGLVFAAELAVALERVEPNDAQHHRELLASLGLPVTSPVRAEAEELTALMARDKKATGGLTFVLPGPNGLERVEDPDARALKHAFAAIGVS